MNTETAYYLRRIALAYADMGTDETIVADLLADAYEARKG